jgi:hypothetical protein
MLQYSECKKIAYIVVMASRKSKHYFQAHYINVLSTQSLEKMFQNRDASSHIGKWAAELNEYIIDFKHGSTIKSQALIEFLSLTELW